MNPNPRSISLPRDVDVTALARALSRPGSASIEVRKGARRVWLDSFDWRVWAAGLVLEWRQARGLSRLRLAARDAGDAAALEIEAALQPRRVEDLPPGVLRRRVAAAVQVRALLARSEVRGQLHEIRILDRRDKTVAWVELWRAPRGGSVTARVLPVRGFERAAVRVARRLRRVPGAGVLAEDPLLQGARDLPVPPGGYPGWQPEGLGPGMRADDALQCLLGHYAHVMELNLPGVRDDLDSEFLHDFRVGLRRSRTLLRRVPGVFAPAPITAFLGDLAWLSRESGPARDADVHQLVFPEYARALGPAAARLLTPVMTEVSQEQRRAHARLAAVLCGARFRRRWSAWRGFLARPAPRGSRQPNGPRSVAPVAAEAIARAARKVRRQGRRITGESPPEAFHEVRKSCKSLRYLIDAFGETIGDAALYRATRRLKALQDLLGEHQDVDVHRRELQALHTTLVARGALDGDAHAALESLMAELGERAGRARARFGRRFARFLDVGVEKALAARRR